MDSLLTKRLLVVFASIVQLAFTKQQQVFLVNEPVVNLRSEPIPLPFNFEPDDYQQTQLLYNEPVIVTANEALSPVSIHQRSDWVYVEAVLQATNVNGSWQGYPGYLQTNCLVKADDLPDFNLVVQSPWASIFTRACNPFGCLPSDRKLQVTRSTFLVGVAHNPVGWWQLRLADNSLGWIDAAHVAEIPTKPPSDPTVRRALVELASSMIGWYYFWGGRSVFNADFYQQQTAMTGVDCSGLVSLSYKTLGMLLPRDAHWIYERSKNVTQGPQALQAADLLFLAHPQTQPVHMYHVMMVLDEFFIVESSYSSTSPDVHNATRIVSTQEKLGLASLKDARWATPVPSTGSLIFWGTYLPWTSA